MRARPKILLLPFGRRERAKNRGSRLGRKKTTGAVPHRSRPSFSGKRALHITLRLLHHVPSLRARHRFAAVREAFLKFREVDVSPENVFRLVHYNVLGNHVHLIVEADSQKALSLGMRKLAHSISRRLNRVSVERSGGSLNPRTSGPLRDQPGWLGGIFSERYHAHRLDSAREIEHAVNYILNNAAKHFGSVTCERDPFTSAADTEAVAAAKLFLVQRAFERWRATPATRR